MLGIIPKIHFPLSVYHPAPIQKKREIARGRPYTIYGIARFMLISKDLFNEYQGGQQVILFR